VNRPGGSFLFNSGSHLRRCSAFLVVANVQPREDPEQQPPQTHPAEQVQDQQTVPSGRW